MMRAFSSACTCAPRLLRGNGHSSRQGTQHGAATNHICLAALGSLYLFLV